MTSGLVWAAILAASQMLVSAQVEVTPRDGFYERLVKRFDAVEADGQKATFACHVEAVQPMLGFSFRFFSGYYANFPARQLSPGKENRMIALFRVTSEPSGEQHYFLQRLKLPEIPADPGKTHLDAGGGFYAGDGSYMVDWLMADQHDRVCKRSWMVKTPKTKVKALLAPGSVAPLGTEKWKGFDGKQPDVENGKVTVFLSAMPLYRRRSLSRLPAYDVAVLLSALTSFLDTTKYTHARVVAFDLLGKRVLFEQDEFDPQGYRRLRDKLETASYGTIDYQSLSRGASERQLLEQMLKHESEQAGKSEAVVFLGAEGPPSDRLPPVFKEYRMGLSRLYYLFFQRFPHPAEDIVYQFVRAGKGKTVNLYAPKDLANAVRMIDSDN